MTRGRPREGGIRKLSDGRFEVCATYTDFRGQRRALRRIAANKTAALALRRELCALADERARAAAPPSAAPRTMPDLLAHFAANHCQPAEYRDGRKISGRRSLRGLKAQLAAIEAHFGAQRLDRITHADCDQFRLARLRTPTARGNPRTIATVNREIALLRRALNVACQQGWISQNPFQRGEPLIAAAAENRRTRILSRDEERRLLAACTGPRAHLYAVVVAALDTGCRKGELLNATWREVELAERTITVASHKGGRHSVRVVGLTERLHAILCARRAAANADDRVFAVGDVKRAWASACRAAGLSELRFHDLRHTAATRLAEALPLAQVGNLLGHTQLTTTARYVNLGEDVRRRAVDALDAFNAETEDDALAETPNFLH
jgi:integrase